MKQQLISEVKLLKPSEILIEAYKKGVRKIEGAFHKDDGHCAIGLLSDKKMDFGEELSRDELSEIFDKVIDLNDQGPHITFLDCARFLESKGL